MRLVAMGVLLGLGCASAASQSAPPASESAELAPACTLRVATGLLPGREVSAEGFAFCVPEAWSQAGARTWHGAGVLRWEVRAPAPLELASDPSASRRRPAVAQHYLQGQPWTESIDGRTVWLANHVAADGRHITGSFADGVPLLKGEAPTAAAAEMHLAIFRSIRFASR